MFCFLSEHIGCDADASATYATRACTRHNATTAPDSGCQNLIM